MRIYYAPLFLGTVLIATLGVGSPACAGDAAILGTTFGAITGGILGNQIGHGTGNFVSTVMGVGIGGAVGNNIGQEIDSESYPRSSYANPGYYGSTDYSSPIVYTPYTPNYVAPPAPPPTYIDQDAGTYCRPFSQEIRIDGKPVESYGTACLQPDGTWRIVQ